jgi:hypothetical protein
MKTILSTLAAKDIIVGIMHIIAAIIFIRIAIAAIYG